jgi:DNA polymerase-3 subunit gamma/tau
MSYQVLARKWRPQTFKDLVGQEHVVQALVNGLDQDRVHHAFLLTGTRGVGKTTIARILAKCLNCEKGVSSTPCGECSSCVDVDEGRFIDMLEIDAASKTKVDDTREMLETVQFTPTRGRYKVYIIDEVHMLSGHSFNALLKTLEEPPPHVKFILATTDPQKLPVTILSRCLRFTLTRLLPDQIAKHITGILKSENVPADESGIMRIARAADGSMRDGLSLLDQAIAFGGGSLKDAEVANMLGSIDHVHVAGLIDALIASDANKLLEIVNDLSLQSRDLESVLDELAEAMHRMALIQAAPAFRDPERADWDSLTERAGKLAMEDVQLYYQIAISGRRDIGLAPDPRTGLEMTLMRMLAFKPAESGGQRVVAPATAKQSSAKQGASQSAAPVEPAAPSGVSVEKPAKGFSAAQMAMAAMEALDKPNKQAEPGLTESGEREQRSVPSVASVSDSASHDSAAKDFAGQRDESQKEVAPGKLAQDPLTPEDWNTLQSSLNLNGAARELARNMQLESAEGEYWRFLVPENLSDLGSDSVVQSLQSALSERVGHSVSLDVHTASKPLKSVAEETQAAEISRMSDAERAIEDDQTVKQIKDQFSATVIADSIQPIQ